MVKKARKRFSHEQYRKWGASGGNKLLLWQKRHPEAAKKLEATVRR